MRNQTRRNGVEISAHYGWRQDVTARMSHIMQNDAVVAHNASLYCHDVACDENPAIVHIMDART